jgi:hypothetical protein
MTACDERLHEVRTDEAVRSGDGDEIVQGLLQGPSADRIGGRGDGIMPRTDSPRDLEPGSTTADRSRHGDAGIAGFRGAGPRDPSVDTPRPDGAT